ncbi:cation transporter [Opitutaceae bacterium TAV5]|nr:cation transporter [Opitutaceae bacterium TAV5]
MTREPSLPLPTQSPARSADTAAARKERVARWSVAASALLTAGKLAAGILSGSLALLSEAVHSLVDTVATLVTWFAVRMSNKPADDEHHYGHGKFESVAALVETGILIALALFVLVKAGGRMLAGGSEIEATPLVYAVIGISIVVDINRIRALNRVARETGSHALAADVLHFSSDLAGSVMVLLGLVASEFGFRYGDALAAAGVAVFIGLAGWRLGRRTLGTLLDTAPKGRAENLRSLAEAIPGVVEVAELRLRPGGNEIFGDMTLAVARTLPLARAEAIRERVLAAVRNKFPDTVLTVATQPRALDDESVRERVLFVAQRRGLPVHHVTVQDLGGRLSISLDLEVDGRMSLGKAQVLAGQFKAALREEFGPDTEVEPHIEPLDTGHLAGSDAPADVVERVARLLSARAANGGTISDVHHVRVRSTLDGLVVNYHCRADAAIDVSEAHAAIDRIDRGLRDEYPDVVRVVGHADLKKTAG